METARLERILIRLDDTLLEAIAAINAGAIEIALVVDADRQLLGSLTDGDVRRALLRGASLDTKVKDAVHSDPISAQVGASREHLLAMMTKHSVDQIPLLSESRVVDVAFVRDLQHPSPLDHPVVILAGGEGMRLRPLTERTPKPMLPVSGTPLLERLVTQLRDLGFQSIMIATGYRSESIEQHFGTGDAFGVSIECVSEPAPLGTAGPLRLFKERLDRPFIALNADILTKVNLRALIRHHLREGCVVTAAVRQYVLKVPYGVVDLQDHRLTGFDEKPSQAFFVNAGIYALDPAALNLLGTGNDRVDMTDLIQRCLDEKREVGAFAVHEYWLDIGSLDDYERSHEDFATHFEARA